MNRKDIVIGLVILAVIAGVVFFSRKTKKSDLQLPSPTTSLEQRVEEKFKFTVPEDVDKVELKDVSGGTSFAIATRKFENGTFTQTILADLTDPASGEFYQGWLVRGKEGEGNYSVISLGKLQVAKGGYLLDFTASKDYSDYKTVVVSMEKVNDAKIETRLLEGSF